MRKRGKADSVTTATSCSTLSPSLFHHERRTRKGGNKTVRKLNHGERRCTSDLSPPVRPADLSTNHIAVREAVFVATAGGRHWSRRSTSVILLFTVVAEPLKLLAVVGAAAG
ncbi:uncharacterized protein DS421_1g11770 [Arachis hypogaea]|nr:uncharacterized protein DS421_1g11770 [Arachis hypogaea]